MTASAQAKASVSVVLVHGGFLGPWSWADVAAKLTENAITTVVPELPSMGDPQERALGDFYADAAAVRNVLDELDYPVLLCGHSYGGAVITEAAGGPHPSVAHLVYLTAAVLDAGESMASFGPGGDAEPTSAASDPDAARTRRGPERPAAEGPVPGPAGTIVLEPDQAAAALFNDCTEERARQGSSSLRPMNPAVGAQPLTRAAWRDIAATFVRGSQDRMPEIVTPAFFDRRPEVITLPAGHCPNWSRPDLVAELLMGQAEKIAT
jgi:pimeloyl-ACP methyl ester carboxylesterase